MARGKDDDFDATALEEGIWADEQRTSLLLRERGERGVEARDRRWRLTTRISWPMARAAVLQRSRIDLDISDLICYSHQYADQASREAAPQQFQPFFEELGEHGTPVTLPPGRLRLATRPEFDGIAADAKDDGNCRCRRFGGTVLPKVRRSRSHRIRRRTRSVAKAGEPIRLLLPPSGYSIAKFWPST